MASAEPVSSKEVVTNKAVTCGSIGGVIDSTYDAPSPTGPVDGSAVSATGVVGQVSEGLAYEDSALQILDVHTELLRQSDGNAPTIVDGRLESGCGVAFVLQGTQKQVGAVGIVACRLTRMLVGLCKGLPASVAIG